MDISGISYLGFQRVIDRGTAEIIEENDNVLFLRDEVSGTYMIACDDAELGMETLKRHEDRGYTLIMTTNKEIAESARDRYGMSELVECFQFAYLGEMPEEDPGIKIRDAELKDLPVIMKAYDMIDEEEMAKDIERGCVHMAYDGDELVGFMGEHLEGSLGMLFVYPEYRRKGYAAALENAEFARTMKKGLIPFGEVITDNTASLELQKKNGLTQADKLVYWVW